MAALMEIIIKAIDKASDVADKVESKMTGMGNKISKAMEKAAMSGDKFTQKVDDMATTGMSAYAQMDLKQQKYLQGLSKGQALLDRMGISGTKTGQVIAAGIDFADKSITRVKSSVETLKQKIESTTVGNKLITGFNTVKNKVVEVGGKIRTSFGTGLEYAKTKVEKLQNSMGELGMAVTSVFGALGLGSVYQATVGLAMVRERMTTLMSATMQSKDAATEFVSTLDEMTNNSLVSLNDLGMAMSKIKMSTGMTNDQLKLIAPTVNDIGQRALLMGKDTTEAQDLMVASFRGLNGEFDMLKTNFGITRQSLIDAGWSGAATDVDGYNNALQKVLEQGGSMSEMMKTQEGQIQIVKKGFSTAGREIGEAFIPLISAVVGFMVAMKQTNPEVFKLIIVVGALVSGFALVLPVLGAVIGSFQSFLIFIGLIKTEEEALTLVKIKDVAVSKASAAAQWLQNQARSAAALVTGEQTAATNASTISNLRESVTQKASAAATWLVNAAKSTYTFLTSGQVVATIASTAAMIAGSAASKAAAAAQWLLNAAMSANPIMIVVIAIIALIAILAILYNRNETVRNAINWLLAGLQQLGGYIYGGLLAVWNALGGTLTWIWNGLVQLGTYIMGGLMAAWNSIVTALAPIIAAFSRLWTAISMVWAVFASDQAGQANGIFTQMAEAVMQLWNALSWLAGLIIDALMPYLQILWEFLSGAFSAVWETVSGVILAVISYVSTFIILLADLLSGNITATEFMYEVWIAFELMISEIFASIINGIGQFALNLIKWAIYAASGLLNAFITYLSQLPGMAWGYFLAFLSYLASLPGRAYNYAASVGSNINNAIASYLSSLPGRMYQWGKNALQSFVNAIINSIPGLRSALDLVSSLFPHSPPKEGPLSEITEKGMHDWLEGIVESGQEVMGGFNLDGLNTEFPLTTRAVNTPEAVTAPSTMPGQSTTENLLNTDLMAEQSQKAINAANQTNTGVSTAYDTMGNKITNTLAKMVSSEQSSWLKIQANNATQLNSMRNSTTDATNSMVDAWNNMAGNIVSSADRIRSNSSGHISNLSVNIKTFYNHLMNPMSWFAGPGPSSGVRRSVSYSAAGTARTPEQILDSFKYIDAPCDNCFAGSWDFTIPNTDKINSTVDGYNVRMPGIDGLHVQDFSNTTNPLYGSMRLYEAVAERLISPTSYDFYFNGRYGDREALARGAFNCWDGAEILVHLAQAMGLSASMIHGRWNGIGHMAALVNGKIFDSTQRQNRGVWRGSPGVSFGPGPANLKDLVSNTDSGLLEIKETLDLNLNINLENVPDDINEESLAIILKEIITDSELVKKLVKNRDFMDVLKVELGKLLKREERKGGSAS